MTLIETIISFLLIIYLSLRSRGLADASLGVGFTDDKTRKQRSCDYFKLNGIFEVINSNASCLLSISS